MRHWRMMACFTTGYCQVRDVVERDALGRPSQTCVVSVRPCRIQPIRCQHGCVGIDDFLIHLSILEVGVVHLNGLAGMM